MSGLTTKHTWQEALSDLVTDPEELLEYLALDPGLRADAIAAARLFPLRVPRGYLARIRKGDPRDPLLLQILPLRVELEEKAGYGQDPLGEMAANPVPGLLHKYHGRVLVTLTGVCAVHCRYCFRRYFPYEENNPGTAGWNLIFDYLRQNSSINEVILSGGDPLAVSDKLLERFTEQLSQISHITRLRLHTRLPIVLPERITTDFLTWLKGLKMQTVVVVHANHPNEISREVKDALSSLRLAGVTVLNQSVLLKDVNDNARVLSELSSELFSSGVLPYYLHMLDRVKGSAHFEVPLETARALITELSETLPGYLVPKLVLEEAGAASKTFLSTGLCTG